MKNSVIIIITSLSLQCLLRLSENSLTISRVDSNSTMSVKSFFESEHRRVFVKEGMVNKTKQDFTDPTER